MNDESRVITWQALQAAVQVKPYMLLSRENISCVLSDVGIKICQRTLCRWLKAQHVPQFVVSYKQRYYAASDVSVFVRSIVERSVRHDGPTGL